MKETLKATGKKLAWFAALWLAGVAAMFLLAYVIRSAIP